MILLTFTCCSYACILLFRLRSLQWTYDAKVFHEYKSNVSITYFILHPTGKACLSLERPHNPASQKFTASHSPHMLHPVRPSAATGAKSEMQILVQWVGHRFLFAGKQ